MKVFNETKGVGVKRVLRDSFVTIVSTLGFSSLYSSLKRRRGPLVRVICFHDIPDREWFESVTDSLVENANLISPEEFHTGIFDSSRVNVLPTFDDGYQSWVDVALPVLAERNIKALFFVNSGLLDSAEDETRVENFMRERLLIKPRQPLTWEGTRIIADAGHAVGGHTRTHPTLSTLGEEEQQREIEDDKKAIESKLGISIHDFAYPFGNRDDYSVVSETLARKAGYTFVYTAEPGFLTNENQHIPRTLIDDTQTPASVMAWVNGGYDIFRSALKFFRVP